MQVKIKYPLTTHILVWCYLYSTYFKSRFWDAPIDNIKVKKFLLRKFAVKLPPLQKGQYGRV